MSIFKKVNNNAFYPADFTYATGTHFFVLLQQFLFGAIIITLSFALGRSIY